MSATPGATRPGRVAFAVVHQDPPQVFIAEDEHVLARLVALNVWTESVLDAERATLEIRMAPLFRD